MLGQLAVKRSVRVGETSIRELAAYLLNHGGFVGVPTTSLVKVFHVAFHVNEATAVFETPYKIASLQNFKATNVGLCLADIGAMMTQEFCGDEETSIILETLCAKAKESVFNTLEADDDKTEVGIEDLENFQFDDNETKGIYNEVADFPKLLQSHDLNLAKS
ncbi:hypothetical protein POUND7_001469 [Theobroma cacao]